MTFSPGDVLLIEVPYADSSDTKPRPAVVLTHPDGRGDFVIAPVTTSSQHANSLPLTANLFAKGALPMASWARPDHPYTVNRSNVVKQFGSLTQPALQAVLKILCPHIGCK